MKKSSLLFLSFVTLIAVLFILLFQSKIYMLHKKIPLTTANQNLLINLALEALKTKEVPVASLILYGGKVIGQGYNTVMRDTNIGGHAEINAISHAIKNVGVKKFNELNRDSLILI